MFADRMFAWLRYMADVREGQASGNVGTPWPDLVSAVRERGAETH